MVGSCLSMNTSACLGAVNPTWRSASYGPKHAEWAIARSTILSGTVCTQYDSCDGNLWIIATSSCDGSLEMRQR